MSGIDWSKYGGTSGVSTSSSGIDWSKYGGQQPPPAHPSTHITGLNPGLSQTPFAQGLTDILRRTSSAGMAAREHGLGAGLHTLLHSNTPEQYNADARAIAKKAAGGGFPLLGPISQLTGIGMVGQQDISDADYESIPAPLRSLAEQVIVPTSEDIMSVLGGAGLTRQASQAIGEHALPVVMKASVRAAKLPGIAGPAAEAVAHYGGKFHNFVTPGGAESAEAMRNLALKYGRQGVQTAQQLYALRNMGKTVGADLEQSLSRGMDTAINGLTDAQKLSIFRAIHNGTVGSLPQDLATKAQQLQTYDRAIPYLMGSKSLRTQMTKRGYQLPPELQRFDQGPLGYITTKNYMPNHIPLIHELDPDTAERIVSGARSKIDYASAYNPQFLRRRMQDPDAIVPLTDAQKLTDAFKSSFQRAGKAWGGAQVQRQLTQMFAPTKTMYARLGALPEGADQAILADVNKNLSAGRRLTSLDQLQPSVQDVLTRSKRPVVGGRQVQRYSDVPQDIRDFFVTPPKPGKPHGVQELGDLGRKMSNIGRASLFTTPFPHQVRIGSLLAAHAPEAIPAAIAKYVKMGLGFASPETQTRVLGRARLAGATGVPSIEGAGDLDKAIRALGAAPENIATKLSMPTKFRKFAGLAKIPASLVEHWYRGVSKSLWTWDDAAKAALYEKNLRIYRDPLRAAYHTQMSLVDYGMGSGLTETLRTIPLGSSFPTWRTRMPFAVLKAATESPQNILTIARIGTLLGIGPAAALGAASFSVGGKNYKINSNAIGEALQVIGDPQGYGRGSLSPSGHLSMWAISALAGHGRGAYPNYWTYGQNPLIYAAKSLPGINQIESYTGNGMVKTTPQDEALYQLTGIQGSQP